MKKRKNNSFDSANTLLALTLLVVAVAIMGFVVLHQSKKSIMVQIKERMLDVAKTASYMIDGEKIKNLHPDAVEEADISQAITVLDSFQYNIDLAYIYCIGMSNTGRPFITVDPSKGGEDATGLEIEKTDALILAFNGTAAADDKITTDKYGDFYSAYSPIFDSDHNVVGVVGVDFEYEWFRNQLGRLRVLILIIGLVSLLLGIVLARIISWNNRRRLKTLSENVVKLGEGFDKLQSKMMSSSIDKLNLLPENSSKRELLEKLSKGGPKVNVNRLDISETDYTMRTLNENITQFIDYIDSQTYIDQTTRTGNKAAYQKARNKAIEDIKKGNAKFGVAFFDIGHMKQINSKYGFEAGDRLIFDTATMLKEIFGVKNVFHITSDEFIVVIQDKGFYDMRGLIVSFDKAVRNYNESREGGPELVVVRGFDAFHEGVDKDYKSVYMKASESAEKYKEKLLEKIEMNKMRNYYY